MGCVTCEQLRGEVQRLHDEREELQRELSLARATVTTLRRRLDPTNAKDPRVVEIFEYWQQQCDHAQTKLTADRARKVSARLREGLTVEQLKVAIDGAARAAYVDPNGVRHDDLALICRSGEKVRLFTARALATAPRVDIGRKLVGA